jgi:hypothetical protein
MSMREKLGENLLWMQSMDLLGMVGVLLIPLGLTEWGFGRILGRDGVRFATIPDSCWEMDLGSVFGMMCGVVRCLCSRPFGCGEWVLSV